MSKYLHSKQKVRQDLNYEDELEDVNESWRFKAQALQARRWRALKREIKGHY